MGNLIKRGTVRKVYCSSWSYIGLFVFTSLAWPSSTEVVDWTDIIVGMRRGRVYEGKTRKPMLFTKEIQHHCQKRDGPGWVS